MRPHLERVGDHYCDEPDCGADTPGCCRAPASREGNGRMDHCEVSVYADTETGGEEEQSQRKEEVTCFLLMFFSFLYFKC